ncbi:ABC transporter ATP-binding protein [Dielma fastidiosa]|uniref:ABC transporter ATP-binding protein n=1 Tax=Dielma fastidiosa TaxID=1034346 RepID=UPI0023EF6B98|nr:ABC transporter ATP-binding protein [Dielma fastidiosa]
MDTILTTESLSKHYGKFKALDNVSMHIPKGAIYGFVGRNGAGKTTLIRLICGLQEPDSGTYTIYGTANDDKAISKQRARMGAVIETPSIYMEMSAEENLKQQARILGLPSFDGIDELLKLIGLEQTGNKKAKHFSLGMRQRLGIGIALVNDPDFLVLDEPTNGLDPQGIIQIRELILKLNQNRQITLLISSHILDELSKLATHFGFIDNGRIVKEISAEQLEMMSRQCLRLEVDNIQALIRVLDSMKLNYKLINENTAEIYGKPSITHLIQELAAQHCEVQSIQEQDESLESYFINLVGGSHE